MNERAISSDNRSKDNKPETASRGASTEELTILNQDIALSIKLNIRNIWDRSSHLRNLTQMGLSKALGVSQGAVSKLLNNDTSHFWTIDKIKKFCDYTRSEIEEVIPMRGTANGDHLLGFFVGWQGEKSAISPVIVDESYDAVEKYFADRGKSPSKSRLEALAASVAVRVSRTDRTVDDYYRAIKDVILDEAAREA